MRLRLFTKPGSYLVTLTLLLVFCIAGCWDITEIDRRTTIIALGLDAAPDNKVLVSAQIPLANPALMGAQPPEKPFTIVTSQAKTSFGATLGLENKTDKPIFFGQLKAVVINNVLAEHGLRAYCEFLERHPENNPLAVVALTETTAQEILSVDLGSKLLPGIAIYDHLQSNAKSDKVLPVYIWQFIKKIELGSVDAALPIIAYNNEEKAYKFENLGVFHRDHLVGKLSENESRMALIMMGKSPNSNFTVPVNKKIGEITYRRTVSKCRISILRTKPNIEFLIKVSAIGFSPELTKDPTDLSRKEIKKIERATEHSLKKDMIETILQLQKLNSDIIGFGDKIRASKPEVWKGLNWNQAYTVAKFQVRVKFTLERVGKYR